MSDRIERLVAELPDNVLTLSQERARDALEFAEVWHEQHPTSRAEIQTLCLSFKAGRRFEEARAT